MAPPVDVSYLTPSSNIQGDTPKDTRLLNGMLRKAKDYIGSFSWASEPKTVYFGGGIGGVLAVFLFEFSEPIAGSDTWLWVIVGDVPSAYLVVDVTPTPTLAIEEYCKLMEEWARAVEDGGSLDDVFPVAAAPTDEHAKMLRSRIRHIRKEVVPWLNVERL